jgi:hypothetical protein
MAAEREAMQLVAECRGLLGEDAWGPRREWLVWLGARTAVKVNQAEAQCEKGRCGLGEALWLLLADADTRGRALTERRVELGELSVEWARWDEVCGAADLGEIVGADLASLAREPYPCGLTRA